MCISYTSQYLIVLKFQIKLSLLEKIKRFVSSTFLYIYIYTIVNVSDLYGRYILRVIWPYYDARTGYLTYKRL